MYTLNHDDATKKLQDKSDHIYYQCTILGCGSANGVPQIGCKCATCLSSNVKNNRTRASLLITTSDGYNVLIDASPDLRTQLLREDVSYIDVVLCTHQHYDHIGGITDIRTARHNDSMIVPIFANEETSKELIHSVKYLFLGDMGAYVPIATLETFFGPFSIITLDKKSSIITIIPFNQYHGLIQSTGFRVGELAYSTDVNKLSEKSYDILHGVKIWIIDCLRYNEAETHHSFDAMLLAVDRVQPELAILTHMAHEIEYYDIMQKLPNNIIPAFDGMKFAFSK